MDKTIAGLQAGPGENRAAKCKRVQPLRARRLLQTSKLLAPGMLMSQP
ncbi:hypothetical protein AB6724_02055 [Comamonas guangdongensis]|uniref:Uncharacterized protein n=1 Tax=Comamonas guangdongensis TaxID=510515 RepID=A0ABV3ZR80_9BURK